MNNLNQKLCKPFMISLLLLVYVVNIAAATESNGFGLTVDNGILQRNGRAWRGIGINYCDLFQELIHQPKGLRTINGLHYLAQKGIPFVRFWGCGFWPIDWDLYFRDKAEWFRRFDQVVRTAEEAGIGLIPSLFWRTETFPELFGEYQDAWGDPASRTRQFMKVYIEEVVTRYKNSPAIWGWEFGNEMNMKCALPNGMQFLGIIKPDLKVNLEKHPRNLMTYDIAGKALIAFATEVRRYDTWRFITSGNSSPRASAWHNATEKKWTADNEEQAFLVFQWMNPSPINVASIHFYPPWREELEYAGVRGISRVIEQYKLFARKLNQPLFIGEFAAAGHDSRLTISIEQYRSLQTLIMDALLVNHIDLAAHWVFDFTETRTGPGLVRKNNNYEWIIDQIVDYNRRIARQLAQESSLSHAKLHMGE